MSTRTCIHLGSITPIVNLIHQVAFTGWNREVLNIDEPHVVAPKISALIACPIVAIKRLLAVEEISIDRVIAFINGQGWYCSFTPLLVYAKHKRHELQSKCIFTPHAQWFSVPDGTTCVPYIYGQGNDLTLEKMPIGEVIADDWEVVLLKCDEVDDVCSLAE